MFRKRLLTCMLVAGLTLSSSALVFAGNDGTEGNNDLVDNTESSAGTENPEESTEEKPDEEQTSGTDSETPNPDEGISPGELEEPKDTTDGSGDGVTNITENTPEADIEQGQEKTEETDDGLPETGAPAFVILPALGVIGGTAYVLHKGN